MILAPNSFGTNVARPRIRDRMHMDQIIRLLKALFGEIVCDLIKNRTILPRYDIFSAHFVPVLNAIDIDTIHFFKWQAAIPHQAHRVNMVTAGSKRLCVAHDAVVDLIEGICHHADSHVINSIFCPWLRYFQQKQHGSYYTYQKCDSPMQFSSAADPVLI